METSETIARWGETFTDHWKRLLLFAKQLGALAYPVWVWLTLDRWECPRFVVWMQAGLVTICVLWSIWLELGLVSWPNLAISLLATAAVMMAIRASDWTKVEQVIWMLIAFALFAIESRSIVQDHNIQETQRQDDVRLQQGNFAAILAKDQRDFDSTMKKYAVTEGLTKENLNKTIKVAAIAEESVAALTGTDSYIEIFPQMGPVTGAPAFDKDAIALLVFVNGKHTSWDTHVEMSNIPLNTSEARPTQYNLGNVSNTMTRTLTPTPLHLDKGKVTPYYFASDSRGSYVQQMISFRYDKDHAKWQFETFVWKGLGNMKVIARINWRDVTVSKSLPLTPP